MLSILSDSQKVVLDNITMKLNLAHAHDFLKNAGYEMSERTYRRRKRFKNGELIYPGLNLYLILD